MSLLNKMPANLLRAGCLVAASAFIFGAQAETVGVDTAEGVKIATAAIQKCGEEADAAALAEAVEKGRAIALANEEYDVGYGDSEAEMRMILYNRHGETSERELRQMSLENPALDSGDKSLIVFDRPRSYKH